ncbi:MAG: helix-turn-helix domain-containing protein [Rubrobacteraceae bacterium]
MQILSVLRDAGEPVRVRDIADALAITSGRVSQLVTRMVDDGHVTRTSKGVRLTSEGFDLVPPDLNFRVGSWQAVDVDE